MVKKVAVSLYALKKNVKNNPRIIKIIPIVLLCFQPINVMIAKIKLGIRCVNKANNACQKL